jgi:hypothetical protein
VLWPIASVLGEIGAAAIGGQPDAKQGRLDGGGEALLRRLDREGLSDMAEALIEPNNGVSRLRDGGALAFPRVVLAANMESARELHPYYSLANHARRDRDVRRCSLDRA